MGSPPEEKYNLGYLFFTHLASPEYRQLSSPMDGKPRHNLMKSQDVIPVLISIIVIILVAVFEKQSKLIAALVATMPLSAPLAIWIVYSSNSGDKTAVSQFSMSLLLGVLPTIGFLIAVWLASRAGLKLVPMLATGYGVWAIGATILFLLRNTVSLK
jgi:uncharacterized membrane protein (GlpM family)